METDETKRRIRKTKEKIFKKLKDSMMMMIMMMMMMMMMEEVVNEDFEKTSNSVKSPGEAVDVVNNMEKIIRS